LGLERLEPKKEVHDTCGEEKEKRSGEIKTGTSHSIMMSIDGTWEVYSQAKTDRHLQCIRSEWCGRKMVYVGDQEEPSASDAQYRRSRILAPPGVSVEKPTEAISPSVWRGLVSTPKERADGRLKSVVWD
jgi:hypothetical protein